MSDAPLILVVDDDAVLCDVLAAVLAESGYAVTLAANGREALERFIARPAHLLLLDIAMPELSGTELFALLGRAGVSVPVVFMSVLQPDAAGPLVTRAAGYLSKPFAWEVLLATVDRVLQQPAHAVR